MTYRIEGHWDARVSGLDGSEYETRTAAETALRRVLPDEMIVDRVDDAVPAWLVYDDADKQAEDSASAKIVGVRGAAMRDASRHA